MRVFVGCTDEIIGISVAKTNVVRDGRIAVVREVRVGWRAKVAIGQECVVAIDIEIIELIELLATDVTAKLDGVFADGFCKIVRELKCVSGLRQFALEVVPYSESSQDGYVGNALSSRNIARYADRICSGSWELRVCLCKAAIHQGGAAGVLYAGQRI